MHYKLTDETITLADGTKLYRIQATKDILIYNVMKGDFGGFVQSASNVKDNAWVYGNACVFGNACVSGDARVSGNACVYGNARLYGKACVYGNARVRGNVCIKPDQYVYIRDVRLESRLDVSLAMMRWPESGIEWKEI